MFEEREEKKALRFKFNLARLIFRVVSPFSFFPMDSTSSSPFNFFPNLLLLLLVVLLLLLMVVAAGVAVGVVSADVTG